ncbi:MAG: tetratricopeptide repeat protein [Opitutae bacterium]|nr:tetratricopeptide repeat protein [Opitutae bacterium]
MARLLAFFFSLSLATALSAADRTPERFALDFAEANARSDAAKHDQAIPLYESLLKEQPKSGELNFRYAYALYLRSLTPEFDGKPGNLQRKKARKALEVARTSDFKEPLVGLLLAHIKADGSIDKPKYSANPVADLAMQEGEAAFVQRDLDAAFVAYQRALEADPKLYRAALFAGDCLFVAGKHDQAIVWFRRATEIDPNQEVAYRYWGDALAKQGKIREALVQMAEAFVADPYGGLAWRTLKEVAEPAGRRHKLPAFKLPAARVEWDTAKKEVHLGLEEKKFTPIDLLYGLARSKWAQEEFAKRFPGQPYRHSLPEEVAALESLLQFAKEIPAAEKPAPDLLKDLENFKPTLELLTRVRDEGLLESFVLFLCADAGIAQDYPAYRAAHRDKLREFVRRYFVNLD